MVLDRGVVPLHDRLNVLLGRLSCGLRLPVLWAVIQVLGHVLVGDFLVECRCSLNQFLIEPLLQLLVVGRALLLGALVVHQLLLQVHHEAGTGVAAGRILSGGRFLVQLCR